MRIETTRARDTEADFASLASAEPTAPATVEEIRIESDPVVYERPSLFHATVHTWHQRHMIKPLMLFFIRRRLRRVKLGPTWLLLNSFMATIGYAIIFGGGVFSVKTPGGMPYFLFMLVGMSGWKLFQTTVNIAMRSLNYVRKLCEDLDMPLLLAPIAGSAQPLFEFAAYLVVYFGTLVFYWQSHGTLYLQLSAYHLFISVAGFALCLALAWGIAFWTSALFILARDTRYIVRYILPFWFFLTPVLYPRDHLHGAMRVFEDLNPLASAIEMIKVGLLGVGSVPLVPALGSIALTGLLFLSGAWFLNRYGHRILATLHDDDIVDEEDDLL